MSTRPLLADSPKTHEAEAVDELAELREEMDSLRADFEALRDGLERDRERLANLLHALRGIFGGEPVHASAATGNAATFAPPSREKWQMWKERLPGACPKVIDALLVQPLTATQLIAATNTSFSTVQRALGVLRNNGLTEKDGARIRLKRL